MGKPVLQGVSLDISPGELVCVLGKNGAGKSTLLKSIAGLQSLDAGVISFDTVDITELSMDERFHTGIMFTYQNPPEIEGVSIVQLIRTMQKVHSEKTGTQAMGTAEIVASIQQLATKLGLPQDIHTRLLGSSMSGGQKKLVEFLQVLFIRPRLALLDEIDSGLDIEKQKKVANMIHKLVSEGSSAMVVTHSFSMLEMLKPKRTLVVEDGKIVYDGSLSQAKKILEHGRA